MKKRKIIIYIITMVLITGLSSIIILKFSPKYNKENKSEELAEDSFGENPEIIIQKDGVTYADGTIIVNKSYSLPSNYVPDDLVTINGYVKVTSKTASSFNNLQSDAQSIGLNIYPSSGYRSYDNQEKIYNAYLKTDGPEKADTYSARPGFSEHQTGLVIDVNTVDMTFDNTNESNWLSDNCYLYGFIIRYPKEKDKITGYMYEPWHLRYVGKELATKLYNNGSWITLEEYFHLDSYYK